MMRDICPSLSTTTATYNRGRGGANPQQKEPFVKVPHPSVILYSPKIVKHGLEFCVPLGRPNSGEIPGFQFIPCTN